MVAVLPFSAGGAQTPPPADNNQPANSQPVQIQADSGVEWDQNAHLYIARGNAVAIRGPSEVHADTLIAHYREVKGGGNTGANTEIYRVDAEGHVTLKRNDETVVGDKAVYDVDTGIGVVTGKGLKLTTPTDVVTARDSLEWYDHKQIGVARGDAVAIRNGRMVKGDILTAYMSKTAPQQQKAGAPGARPGSVPGKPPITPVSAKGGAPNDEASKISRIDAQGHVVVSNGADTGRGNFGVYNADTGIATLIGNVVIERGNDVIRGQRGVMDLNRNISRILPGGVAAVAHPRVQGLFVRSDQGGAAPAHSAGPGGEPAAKKQP